MGEEGILDFESYAQSEQYLIDQATFNDWQTRVYANGEQLGVHFDQAYQDLANASAARLNAFQEYNAQTQILTTDLNTSLVSSKPPTVRSANDLSPAGSMTNSFMNDALTISSGLTKDFREQWQYNFETMLGPMNPLFVDAERGILN